MSYTREQLIQALRAADAAGDTEGARRIAAMVRDYQEPVIAPVETVPEQAVTQVPQQETAAASLGRFLEMTPEQRQAEAAANIDPQYVDRSIGQRLGGIAETAGSVVSSAIAEPVAGIAGIAGSVLPGAEGQGARWVEGTRGALTYSPSTEAGQEYMQNVGEALQPVGEALQGAQEVLGETAYDITGSPAIAAAAETIPAAALELIGLKGLKSAARGEGLSRNAAKAVTQSMPDIKQIKEAAARSYAQIDDLGVKIKPEAYNKFASQLSGKLTKEGLDPDLHPKSFRVLRRISQETDEFRTPSDIETLRKIAQDAAGSIDKADARLGKIIINEIDSGLDDISNLVGGDLKKARALWRKGAKAQQISDMVEQASDSASGLENGLRTEARKILRSAKKKRGFNQQEIAALKQVAQGTTLGNIAKFLGKFGISENQATNMLGASVGAAGGAGIGAAMFGPIGGAAGAAIVPTLGQIAKKVATRITQNNVKYADELIRAGTDAKEITKAYLKNTPKTKQNAAILSDLLADPNITASSISKIPMKTKIVEDAKWIANEIKRRTKKAGAVESMAAPSQINREEDY